MTRDRTLHAARPTPSACQAMYAAAGAGNSDIIIIVVVVGIGTK
jgi:hypothetical protein